MKNARRQSTYQRTLNQLEHQTLGKLFAEKQTDEAEKLAQALTQRFPDYGFAWKVLGAIYQNQGRYK